MTSTSPPTFTVVIPLFNKERAIESTVRSVLAQSRPPDELIIVDDGSSDRSVANAKRALADAPKDLRWRIISQENAGECAARNSGVDAANCQYILFLDADDEWRPGCVAEFEKLALAFPASAVLSVRLMREGQDGRLVPDRIALPDDFFGIVHRPLAVYRQGYGLMSSSSVGVRRDVLRKYGGFPAGVVKGGDLYLWINLLANETLAHSALPLSLWRQQYSGVGSRGGIVPYHLAFFLGSHEGLQRLSCPDVRGFLSSNLIIQIGSHLEMGDRKVARELQRLSRALSVSTRLKSAALMFAPQWSVRLAAFCRRRARYGSREA